ncbi:HpcH/HpaI aldolase/citrate lyase family protein [Burkholderia alba]|uniref:HpcH/HpaI aldolase/citrate lyase family protein n=1 Tax=Burkholderia alba TaxID=2683677 RepID=UPI002B0558DA|nr:HpcH/HpaI aldolase/citrate lyase family protein [Burkholderia alba]
MKKCSPYSLGATLYMPATRTDILDVVMRRKLTDLRSLVVCLEDSVTESHVELAMRGLETLLADIDAHGGRPEYGPLLFVRPRNAAMAATINDWPLIRHVDGFVIPKRRLGTAARWASSVDNPDLLVMPTLETAEAFHPGTAIELGEALKAGFDERILALRIGANDLLGCLGLRRHPAVTLYDTPMSYVIPMLCGVMGAQGFALTAPVFEQIAAPDLLEKELALDISHGLVGKTAIHPAQIKPINDAFRVSANDLDCARMIVEEGAPAVFKFDDAMCEPATHYRWASNIIDRAKWFGIREGADAPAAVPA